MKCVGFILVLASLAMADGPFESDSIQAESLIKLAPMKPAKVNWKKGRLNNIRFENPRELDPDQLWAVLDWAGGEAGWTEVDLGGILSPALTSKSVGAKQVWFRKAPGVETLIATLKGKISASIEISNVGNVAESRQPLVCRYKGDISVFRDFSPRNSELCALTKTGKCLFMHYEDSRLTAEVTQNSVSMLLRAPDLEPFPTVPLFNQLSDAQKEESVQEYRSYFQHEFNMAVRSFVETTPGLFNWQVWHWMEWGEANLVSRQEIRALLESGGRPGKMDLFKATCSDGRKVKIWSDGQGTMGMVLQ